MTAPLSLMLHSAIARSRRSFAFAAAAKSASRFCQSPWWGGRSSSSLPKWMHSHSSRG